MAAFLSAMGQFCMLVCVLFLVLASLALHLVALLTDNWYRVSTDNNINPVYKQNYNFHFGLWRMCYDDMPAAVAEDDSHKEGSCKYIHKALIMKDEGDLDTDSYIRLHLSRTVLGCSIAACAVTLASLLSLLCGVWPAKCRGDTLRKPCLYLSVSVLLLMATLCGITSGVSFIAVRDLDNTTFRTITVVPPAIPLYATQDYDWSFIVHWVATGLNLIASFLLLCLLKNSYELVQEDNHKSTPYNHF